MDVFSPLSSMPGHTPQRYRPGTIQQIEKTSNQGLVQSTKIFLQAINKNRQNLNQEAKRIESKLPDQEEKLLLMEGTNVFSMMQSIPLSERAQITANIPLSHRIQGIGGSSLPNAGLVDSKSQQDISQIKREADDRLNPQKLEDLDLKTNLQKIKQEYEEFKKNPPHIPRKYYSETWEGQQNKSGKMVKFKGDRAAFKYPTHGRGMMPPIGLDEETFMSNPNLYAGGQNMNECAASLEEKIRLLQQRALLKQQQLMDPHKRQYVKKFKHFLYRKYKGEQHNSMFMNTQHSQVTNTHTEVFSDKRGMGANQSRFSYANTTNIHTPQNLTGSRNVSRSRGQQSHSGHIRVQNQRDITTYSGNLVVDVRPPDTDMISPLYTGKEITSSISMLNSEILAHFKQIFQSLDTDGYQIVNRSELLERLRNSEIVRPMLENPAICKPETEGGKKQGQIKTVENVLQEIENNTAKRRDVITMTQFQSYFDYFGAVANSEDSGMLKTLGAVHSRAFYELFQSVMEARREAQKEGSMLEPAFQIQQLMEAVESDHEIPQARKLSSDFPKEDVLVALEALIQCERELSWQELSNNLNSLLSQAMNESEGSDQEIPRQGRRLAAGEEATEESSKVAVAWSVRTLYQGRKRPGEANKGLRAVTEHVGSRTESGGRSSKQLLSPSAGERVVMIKQKSEKPERKVSSSHACHPSSQSTIVVDCKSPLAQGESTVQSVHGKVSGLDGQSYQIGSQMTMRMHPPTTSPPQNWEERPDFPITVPQPYSFAQRDKKKGKTIMQQKTEAMIEMDRMMEERELQAKFRAKEVPATNEPGLFEKIIAQNEERRQEVKERSAELTKAREKPFNFYIRQQQKKEAAFHQDYQNVNVNQHCQINDVMAHHTFHANPIPEHVYPQKSLTQAMEEDRTQREQRVRERARVTLANASMPPRMELHQQKLKENQQALSTLSERRLDDTIFTFKPPRTKKVPDFKEKQRKFKQQLEQKKSSFKATEPQPFNFNEKRAVNLWAKQYMDEENDWRNKYPLNDEAAKAKREESFVKPKINPPSTKKHDAQVALRRKQMVQSKERQEIKEIEDIERVHRQNRLAPRVINSPQLVRNQQILLERSQLKMKEVRDKMRKNEWEYKNSLDQIAKNVDERALLMEQIPHKSAHLGLREQPEDPYLVERLTEILREQGYQGPITVEIIQQLKSNEELMQQIYAEEDEEQELEEEVEAREDSA